LLSDLRRQMKRNLFMFLIVAIVLPVPFVMAKNPGTLFKPSIIQIQKDIINAPADWSFTKEGIAKKIVEGTALFKDVMLQVGSEKISYTEKRVLSDGGKVTVSEQKFKDYEREIALVLLNEKTGKLDVIKIVKRGGQLVNPPGYQIQIVERMNGIRWNHWATQYKVISPKNLVVLLNKYPIEKDGGEVEYFIYSAYSDDLDKPALIEAGAEYLDEVVGQARQELRQNGVMSKAVPNKLVVDVLPADYYKHLPFLEQSDSLEALANSEWTTKRILGTLGYNKDKAWTMSSNFAGANGWIQFTDNGSRGRPGTYTTIARQYPNALLDPDFRRGAANHVNSMKAAMLLHDNNLALLVNKFGNGILTSQHLEEYLAAAYNGSPSHVVKSIAKSGILTANWYGSLMTETKGYIAKLRLLNDSNILEKYLD